ncbi:DUF4476 domain-containing protein [Pontibacter actiniarum]|uniref:DUF4476 domain-containing protein n=1 Tax=Pontibacter actiniarum TaxID=323450 RepID=A0A1X9YW16_9BACT|nr:DUF4476 domain-containing protein [Pontibacter actiniarum]ARS37120.1 hypothetical protein CA264_17710 [Pontibacter actiniarum]
MKRYLLPLLLVLLALPVFAQASVLTFTAERGEFFQVEVDGQIVNRTASNYVRLNTVRPGKHYVELRVRSRHGMYKMGQKIFVPDRVEANYGVRTVGRSGKAYLALVSEVPLAPPVIVPRYPEHRHDAYCGHDYYEPAPPRYNDEYGRCRNLLTGRELDRLLETIRSRDFESTRLSIARDAIRNSSLMAEDLKRLLQQFEYESSRIEFAKYAYDYLCDREHFYYIYDLFRFDVSVRELEEYTSRRR